MTTPVIIPLRAVADASQRSLRGLQKAAKNGHRWSGFDLPFVQMNDTQRDSSRRRWALDLSRASSEFLDAFPALRSHLAPNNVDVSRDRSSKVEPWRLRVQSERFDIIRPAIDTPPRSAERAAALKLIASKPINYRGKPQKLTVKALRGWLQAYEQEGLIGLTPKANGQPGKVRVLVSRAWDHEIDLPDDVRVEVAKKVAADARSMMANDGVSQREVLRLSGQRLARHCAEHGSKLPSSKLKQICRLNAKWADRAGLKQYALVATHDKDHKAFQDAEVARIRRDLHSTPMGLLIGDVHYADILVEEEAEPVRVRLIAWLDASSLFAWVTPVFLSKGKGIRQEDVAASLAQVAMCPHGGIPQEFYLDNGSEYGQIMPSMGRLAVLADREFKVTLARPYSPTSKGEIEGFFGILEPIFKGLPGWIGGDRTNKKTANKGKVVEPYKRGLDHLAQDILAAVAIYNDRPQTGRLNGLSPIEMLERRIDETGFVARVPSERAFDLMFSKSETRKIRQSMIEYDHRQWYCRDLAKLPAGTRVEILIPLRGVSDLLFVRHRDLGDGCWVQPEQIYQHGDRDGARRQSELERHKKDVVRALRQQIDPTISTFEFQKQAIERIAPNAPSPEFWTQAIDKTAVPPGPAEIEADEDQKRRAEIEDFLRHYRAGEERRAGET
ncbi:integrase catalytic domain-containing protein [Palleronia caenipelagi]|uniref:Transposase family protein n=1 Tax=Palleronia caenipelagi TaxID=2489174 RepID=A0A547Q844_9RHOB|nr:DDE-type integrase/transposase/recombinase [Palleronia caenipelagi]TRD22539.1 transposase family protein [Palleronia caenipelagi]